MKNELARAVWFKSSHSAGGQDCVEVAFLDSEQVGVRDSKHSAGPALVFTGKHWDDFLASGIWDR